LISANIEVVGNSENKTTAPIVLHEFTISWVNPKSLLAESSSASKHELEWMIPRLQANLLYQFLDPIRLHVPMLYGNDIILRDPRVFCGPAPSQRASNDVSSIRDTILEYELSGGSYTRMATLRQSASLLYAVEHLVRAVLNPQAPLPELYKVIESIKHDLGAWASFRSIGIEKNFIDYIKYRANNPTDDQRHAPSVPTLVSNTPNEELRECLVRTRHIILSYANYLLA
jgi:hypothetical protein